MRPGRMRAQVTLEKATKVPNGQGGFNLTWAAQFERRCSLIARSQSPHDSQAIGGRRANSADYDLVVQLDEKTITIGADWRVSRAGRILAIQALAMPDYERREVRMVVQEGQPT